MKVKAPVAEGPSSRAVALKAEMFGSDFTVEATAHILGVDRTTILRYLRDNVLFGYMVGREWHVPESAIRDMQARAKERARRRGATNPIDDWSV